MFLTLITVLALFPLAGVAAARPSERGQMAALLKRLRLVRARASKRPGSGAITAEAGVIGVVSINIGRSWAADSHYNIVENRNRIRRQNLCAVAAKRDVRNEVELAVAARRVKFQYRISRERAAADIEHAVCAEHAGFEHICVSAGIIECDRSIAVDVVRNVPPILYVPPLKLMAADLVGSGPRI